MSNRTLALVVAAAVVASIAKGEISIREIVMTIGTLALAAVAIELIRYWYDV